MREHLGPTGTCLMTGGIWGRLHATRPGSFLHKKKCQILPCKSSSREKKHCPPVLGSSQIRLA